MVAVMIRALGLVARGKKATVPPDEGREMSVRRSVRELAVEPVWMMRESPALTTVERKVWEALEAEAARQALPLNALVARIDVERMEATDPPNLTSAIRQWLWLGIRAG